MRGHEDHRVTVDAWADHRPALRPIVVSAIFAAIGVALPVAFLALDRSTPGGWWPSWIAYFWPTDFMTGPASGVVDLFFYEIAAVAIVINAALYALVGLAVALLLRATRAARANRLTSERSGR